MPAVWGSPAPQADRAGYGLRELPIDDDPSLGDRTAKAPIRETKAPSSSRGHDRQSAGGGQPGQELGLGDRDGR